MTEKELDCLAEKAEDAAYMLVTSLKWIRKSTNKIISDMEHGRFEKNAILNQLAFPVANAIKEEARLDSLLNVLKEQGKKEPMKRSDDELRQKYEGLLRELFAKYNIPEKDGFNIAEEILDYAISFRLDGIEQK